MKSNITTHSADSEVSRITGERHEKFRALQELLEENRKAWTNDYPDHWVAIGIGGIEDSRVDFDELLKIVGNERVLANDLIIELLETNPVRLAL